MTPMPIAASDSTERRLGPTLYRHAPELALAIERFKRHILTLDRQLADGHCTPESAGSPSLAPVAQAMDHCLNEASALPPSLKAAIGREAQLELLPFLLLTSTAERMYAKPRGYAGDADTIARIYAQAAGGHGRIGPWIDSAFLNCAAAEAVRNRRHLLGRLVRETMLERSGGEPTRVTSLACGPAQEVFDLFDAGVSPAELQVELIDIDEQALLRVGEGAELRGLGAAMRLHQANLLLLATGRRRLALAPQHLVYSIGLIDYFDDARVVRLIDWAYGLLAPGGSLVLGNFHPRNPDRALMDHVLDWKLIHRSECDMHRLFEASRFGRQADRILFEERGINLFAQVVKY